MWKHYGKVQCIEENEFGDKKWVSCGEELTNQVIRMQIVGERANSQREHDCTMTELGYDLCA